MSVKINDCWNQIGVWHSGEQSCPKLDTYIHCRNCPVYTQAGLDLLDQDVSKDYVSQNSERYHAEMVDTEDYRSLIIFRKNDDWLALETSCLAEICEYTSIHSIPHSQSPHIAGLANIRGELELCICIGTQTEIEADNNSSRRLIVTNLESGKYVLPCDEIKGIFNIPSKSLRAAPATITSSRQYLTDELFEFETCHIGKINSERLDQHIRSILP